MAELLPEDYPAIRSDILDFDRSNDLLSFVYDHSIGAHPIDMPIIEEDMLDAYYNSIRLLRTTAGLAKFLRSCVELVVDDEIQHDSRDYAKARDFAVSDPEDETAEDQFDDVLKRFASHNQQFEALFGSVFARKKSATRPVQRAPKIRLETTDVVEVPEPAGEPKLDQARLRAIERERTLAAQRERRRSHEELIAFNNKLTSFVVNLINNSPNRLAIAKSAVDETQEILGITRDEAGTAVNNVIDGQNVFRAGSRDGYTLLAAEPIERSRQRVSKTKTVSPKEIELESPFSPHELHLARRICGELISVGHQNKGLTPKALATRLGMDVEEVRTLTSRMARKSVVAIEQRWLRSHSPNSKKQTASFVVFRDQDTWDLYKANASDVLKVLTEA